MVTKHLTAGPSKRKLLNVVKTYTAAQVWKAGADARAELEGQNTEQQWADEAVERATKKLHETIEALFEPRGTPQ